MLRPEDTTTEEADGAPQMTSESTSYQQEAGYRALELLSFLPFRKEEFPFSHGLEFFKAIPQRLHMDTVGAFVNQMWLHAKPVDVEPAIKFVEQYLPSLSDKEIVEISKTPKAIRARQYEALFKLREHPSIASIIQSGRVLSWHTAAHTKAYVEAFFCRGVDFDGAWDAQPYRLSFVLHQIKREKEVVGTAVAALIDAGVTLNHEYNDEGVYPLDMAVRVKDFTLARYMTYCGATQIDFDEYPEKKPMIRRLRKSMKVYARVKPLADEHLAKCLHKYFEIKVLAGLIGEYCQLEPSVVAAYCKKVARVRNRSEQLLMRLMDV